MFSQGLEGMATGPEKKDPVYDAIKALNKELHQIHTEQEFLMLNEKNHCKSTPVFPNLIQSLCNV